MPPKIFGPSAASISVLCTINVHTYYCRLYIYAQKMDTWAQHANQYISQTGQFKAEMSNTISISIEKIL